MCPNICNNFEIPFLLKKIAQNTAIFLAGLLAYGTKKVFIQILNPYQ